MRASHFYTLFLQYGRYPESLVFFLILASVQPQSETVWRQADRYWVPRILFVNKLDRTSADCFHVIYNVNKKLNARAVAM
jgi:elongation factor G